MNPEIEYWDATALRWQADAGHRLWRRHSDAVNARLLARWLPPPRRIGRILKTDAFDEAFGDGLVGLLRERAATVVAIDLSPQVLHTARGRCPGTAYLAADVRGLPFADATFDCAVSLSTLDHFTSHDQIATSLRELTRVLRPGGQLVLTMDNLANPLVWLRNGALLPWLHRAGIVPYFVGKTCGPRRLIQMVKGAGLDVRDVEAVLHCPRVVAVALAKRLSRARDATQRSFLRSLMTFEHFSQWPTRYLSGYFTAVRATKP